MPAKAQAPVFSSHPTVIRAAQGICFAIAASTAERIAVALIREGRVRRAYLGIGGHTLALPRRIVRHFGLPSESGVRVETVERGSPADAGGVSRGDVIVMIDAHPVTDIDALQRALATEVIGREIELTLVRRDRTLKRAVRPTETPAQPR